MPVVVPALQSVDVELQERLATLIGNRLLFSGNCTERDDGPDELLYAFFFSLFAKQTCKRIGEGTTGKYSVIIITLLNCTYTISTQLPKNRCNTKRKLTVEDSVKGMPRA